MFNKIINISDSWPACKKIITSRSNKPDLPLLLLPELNKKIWGLRRGRLTIIGARTSHGKSVFALQIAFDLALQGKSVMFLSLEMSVEEMVERLLCCSLSIDNYDLLRGKFEENKEKMEEFEKMIDGMNLSFSNCIGYKWNEIEECMRRFKTKPDVVILDYVQAIKGLGGLDKHDIDDYIRNFRIMAMEHNFAGVLCSQVNRTGQDARSKEPQLHQLKGSGSLEEHADVIILLYWDYHTNANENKKNEYLISVAKNRNGRTGFINLKFKPEYYKFYEKRKEDGCFDSYVDSLNMKIRRGRDEKK